MNKKLLLILCVFLLVMPTLTGCTQEGKSEDRITVAASIVPVASFIKEVGGEFVEVVTMIPPGASTANYSPTPKELTLFSKSALYFSAGVPADIANILPKAKEFNSNIRVIKLYEEVGAVYKNREFAPGKRDPHIWLSPKRAKIMIDIIVRELSSLDQFHSEIYKSNAEKYKNKLTELDKEICAILGDLNNKTFIVYHPAFGYFADDYGLKMVTIEKEGKEATIQQIEEVINLAKRENVKTVFYQKEIDSKQVKAIIEEVDGLAVQLDPLAADYLTNLKKTAKLIKNNLN